MEVLRPVLDSSRDGLFGGMKQKKNRWREYFCPDRFVVNIIFENVPDVKMGKTQRIWTAHVESFQNPVSDPSTDV